MSNSQIVKILCFEQYAKFVLMHFELAQKQHQQGQVYVTGLSQFKLMFKCKLYIFQRTSSTFLTKLLIFIIDSHGTNNWIFRGCSEASWQTTKKQLVRVIFATLQWPEFLDSKGYWNNNLDVVTFLFWHYMQNRI